MAASEVSICNQSISWLGGNHIIALSDNTPEGRLCLANYEPLRDAVLEDRVWTFASERAILPPSIDAPDFQYQRKFQLPSNCIRLVEARDNADFNTENTLEWEKEGRFIITDATQLYIKYIKRVTSPPEFSPGYVQALAARIAMDIAIPLTRSRTLQKDMAALYEAKLTGAATNDAMQGRTQKVRASRLVKRRRL